MYCVVYTKDDFNEVFGPFISDEEALDWSVQVQKTKGWLGNFFITDIDNPKKIISDFPLTPIPHYYNEGCGALDGIEAISLEDFKSHLPSHS
jgi:hypothetical protein